MPISKKDNCSDEEGLIKGFPEGSSYKLKELLGCDSTFGNIVTAVLIDENGEAVSFSSNKEIKPSIITLNENKFSFSTVSTSLNANGKCCVTHAGITLCEGDGWLGYGPYWYKVDKDHRGKCCVYQAQCQFNGAGSTPTVFNKKKYYCES